MLAVLIVAALNLQGPQAGEPDWLEDGLDPRRPAAVRVVGSVELSPAEAFASARSEAATTFESEAVRTAFERAGDVVPFWMPNFIVERVVDRWQRQYVSGRCFEIVDREDVVRDHGFGPSFQTHLLVEPLPPSDRAVSRLRHRVHCATEALMVHGGGTLAFWAVLAIAFWWIDRLSRGYMSGRLLTLALALGVTVPSAAFFMIQ